MMTTMIARLRALRWPLLRTVDYTGICTSVSAAQLLTAAATVCSDQIRELTLNMRGTVRPHVTLSSVLSFGVFIRECGYTRLRQSFHNHCKCFPTVLCFVLWCRLSLLTAVGYGTVVDVYKLSNCDRTAISIENLLRRHRKPKPVSFSRKIQIPLSQTFSAQSCLCCGSKQNKKQRHLAH